MARLVAVPVLLGTTGENTHRQLFKVIVNARPERGGFVSANSYSSDGFGFRVLETKILMSKF